ncbi:hypothetical protein BASA81_003613 [Batrachochytrium salamandrivorans]|nr:hypothetical protein BASA81_003613 [Batrachochytrium salamandrivorans]
MLAAVDREGRRNGEEEAAGEEEGFRHMKFAEPTKGAGLQRLTAEQHCAEAERRGEPSYLTRKPSAASSAVITQSGVSPTRA